MSTHMHTQSFVHLMHNLLQYFGRLLTQRPPPGAAQQSPLLDRIGLPSGPVMNQNRINPYPGMRGHAGGNFKLKGCVSSYDNVCVHVNVCKLTDRSIKQRRTRVLHAGQKSFRDINQSTRARICTIIKMYMRCFLLI